ncbi:B12-binding domain-containing radical SAM protein [Pseudopedobacter beijingensis]
MELPKILLTTLNAKYIHMNLAIRILFDLNKDRANLSWKEFTIKMPADEIAAYCKEFDVVCFSCYIWNITETLEVTRIIKEYNPETKILLGGPEVSYEWQGIIDQDHIDYIITGEGEIPFEKFLTNYPNVNNIHNLVYKENGQVCYSEKTEQFDIKLLADRNPYQYDLASDLSHKVSYIETSRGCPYKCEFCLASLDNRMRYLPMETIKQNLLYLMEHGRTIKFLDRTFNIKREFTLELFQFILDNHRPGNVFQFEITADIVHPDIIKFVNEKVPPGLFRFEIGIQTVNQASNLEVSRKQNFEKTSSIIKQLDERIEMHLDLIVGLPLEYMDDLKFSFESTFKLYPPELQLGFLKFLKGTPVRQKYEQYGYVFDPNPPYQIIKSDFLSEEDLHRITLMENALEIYWNKKRCAHLLKYISENFSIFDYLMTLGGHFEKHYDFHRHSLNDIFNAIYDFNQSYADNNEYIKEFFAIDYYLYSKQRPKDLYGLELEKSERNNWIEILKLNHQKYRFTILPISFDWNFWLESGCVFPEKGYLIIKYDGRTQPEVVYYKNQLAIAN